MLLGVFGTLRAKAGPLFLFGAPFAEVVVSVLSERAATPAR